MIMKNVGLKRIGALFLTVLMVSCGNAKNTTEKKRYNAFSEMENYTWEYYTKLSDDDTLTIDNKSFQLHIEYTYNGKGLVTSTNAMAIDKRAYLYTYPMEYMQLYQEKYECATLEDAIKHHYIDESDTYKINYDTGDIVITHTFGFDRKSYVMLNEQKNRYYYAEYKVYEDHVDERVKPYYLQEDKVNETIKGFVSLNKPLFETIIDKQNSDGKQSYTVNRPAISFYYANSGGLMVAHKMDSISLTFGDKNQLSRLEYVYEYRVVTVTFSNIGDTVMEPYPGTEPLLQ